MKIKKIKSKKEKMLLKLDIIVLIICLIIYVIRTLADGYTPILFDLIDWLRLLVILEADFPIILIVLSLFSWILTFNLFTKCFWFIIIYLAYRIPRKKAIKRNLQYEVIDNIDYYRETFNNITPAEISLISDLEIEQKKDISASIVRLYQKGNIEFNENEIVVKNKDNLKPSELELINMIGTNEFNSRNIKNWEEKCVEEALINNYIKIKDSPETKKPFFTAGKVMKMAFLLLVVSLIVLWNSSASIENLTNFTTEYDNYISQYCPENLSNSQILEILKNDPKFLELYKQGLNLATIPLYLIIIITLSFIVLIACPFYIIIKKVFHRPSKSSNKYERTKSGKILVEQIAGIQKYIHDFSLLSEKDKEHVKVWEDFLIYAIVLEENESIINDIFKYKNINFNIFNSINELFEKNT